MVMLCFQLLLRQMTNDDKRCYNDHYNINRLVYATLKSQEEERVLMKLVKEFQFICFHADRRGDYVAFLKPQLLRSGNEWQWCRLHPPKECKAYDYEQKNNGARFDTMPSPNHPGHSMTYLERENYRKLDRQHDLFYIGKWSICVNWWFSSKNRDIGTLKDNASSNSSQQAFDKSKDYESQSAWCQVSHLSSQQLRSIFYHLSKATRS